MPVPVPPVCSKVLAAQVRGVALPKEMMGPVAAVAAAVAGQLAVEVGWVAGKLEVVAVYFGQLEEKEVCSQVH